MAKEIWDEFDEKVDLEGLKKDVTEAAENGSNFKDVPHGDYEVKVNKMELKKSKGGKIMLSIWFQIVSGEYKGSLIFYNQVIEQGFGIHNACEMLRSLDSGVEVEFTSYKNLHETLLDIIEAVDGKLEYQLSYTENKKNKDFSDYEIVDVFEV